MNPYLNLENYLADGQWREAYRETKTLILEEAKAHDPFLKNSQRSHLAIENVLEFPSVVLAHLDRLWLEHSYGKFGFGVQKNIYHEVGGTDRFEPVVWTAFCDRLGWPSSQSKEDCRVKRGRIERLISEGGNQDEKSR